VSRRPKLLAAVLMCLAPLVAGCLGIPEEGPVVETQPDVDTNEQLGYYNDPRPPTPGDAPAEIVTGFLEAMTAIPVQTNTAEQYLTREAAASWRPQRQIITYADASLPEGSNQVTVELSGADRIDGGGAWRGPLPPEQQQLSFSMHRVDGEWRIADAPDALVVPEAWFSQAFRRVSLYFVDPSARIMVPEPVFLPRGDQLPTALVQRLIQGPAPRLADVETTFIPPGLDVGLAIPVSDAGIADIRLTGGGAVPTEREAALMVSQLAWTLSQDSSLTGMRVSIDGEPLILSGGEAQFQMDRGRYYDPTGYQATSALFGLRDGRLVLGGPDELAQAPGPMGVESLGVAGVAANLAGTRVAGVTTDRDRLLLTDVRDPDADVTTIVQDGTRLLAPSWDFADRMWITNRPAAGAQLSVRHGPRVRPVRVPGISGEDVVELLVSRDGSRLVAAIDGGSDDRIVVSRVEYDGRGRVKGGTRAREIAWDDQSRLSVLDIGWTSATSIAVLHRLSGDLAQIATLPVDGAPAVTGSISVTLQGPVLSIASSPGSTDPLLVLTRGGLLDPLDSSDAPILGTEDVTSPTYVG
jgi:hypothetical protein